MTVMVTETRTQVSSEGGTTNATVGGTAADSGSTTLSSELQRLARAGFDPFAYSITGRGNLSVCPIEAPAVVDAFWERVDNPFGTGGGLLLFLDECPTANWSHQCTYIFVKNAEVLAVSAKMPPADLPLILLEQRG